MILSVRRAKPADIPIIVQILTDATAYKVKHGDMAWDDGAWSNAEVATDMRINPMYTVLHNDEIVGVCILQWEDKMWGEQSPNAGYLHRLAVRKDLHGQNLGAQIMDWATDQVRKKHRTYLRLDCPADNQQLCAYYASHGFTKIDVKPNPMVSGYTAAYFGRLIS